MNHTVITKNYESRKKSRFLLGLNEILNEGCRLRLTLSGILNAVMLNLFIQDLNQIYGQTINFC